MVDNSNKNRYDAKWWLSNSSLEELEDLRTRVPRLLEENKLQQARLNTHYFTLTNYEDVEKNSKAKKDLYEIEAALRAHLEMIEAEFEERKKER